MDADDKLICDEPGCNDPIHLSYGGYCPTHGEPPEPRECKRDGCDNEPESIMSMFCSLDCATKALHDATESLNNHS